MHGDDPAGGMGQAPIPGSPPPGVLAAFGAHQQAHLLAGGQGNTWVAGEVVLKPCALPAEGGWVADVLTNLPPGPGLRVPRPLRATDGGWVVSGWHAFELLVGETDSARWDETLEVGHAFHAPLAGLPRPDFLDVRDDPWAFADRLAWDELPFDAVETMPELLGPLAAARREIDLDAQPVHGDLLGNILFAAGRPPAVIDWSVYHRPPGWASAVVVVDALTWHDAPPALLDRGADIPEWGQLLVRALLYRIATNEGVRRRGRSTHESVEDYREVTGLVLDRASAG